MKNSKAIWSGFHGQKRGKASLDLESHIGYNNAITCKSAYEILKMNTHYNFNTLLWCSSLYCFIML